MDAGDFAEAREVQREVKGEQAVLQELEGVV